MLPLSRDTHKTLLPIAGVPLLARMVGALRAAGIDDITLVTGYRAAELRAAMAERFPEVPFRWVHNDRYEQTNNIFSLALAFAALPDDAHDILLLEGDLVFQEEVLAKLLACPHPNAALLDRYAAGMDGTVVSIAGDGRITAVHPPHVQDAGFDFADKYKTLNIYRFSADFYRESLRQQVEYYARSVDDNCYYELILGILIYLQRAEIYGVVLDGETWAELDDPVDLAVAEFQFDPAARHELLSSTHGGYWKYDVVDHCYLRNMHFPPRSLLADLRNSLPALLHNYGSAQHVVDRQLAAWLDVPADGLVALNGCAQVYPWLTEHLRGRRVWRPEPTFGEYPRAFPEALTYADDFGIDLGSLDLAAGDAVVLVNPNNPTGTTLPTRELLDLARRHPDVFFVLDESFIEFTDEPSALDLDPPANVLVLKSLSKSLGVPGARLGVAWSADPELVADLRATLPIWNLNSVAEYLLEMLFKYRVELADSFARTRSERATFEAQLAGLPDVHVFPGGGNFVVIRLERGAWPSEVASRLLAQHKVYVKDLTGRIGRDGTWLRLAVRTVSENRRLVERLAAVHGEWGHE